MEIIKINNLSPDIASDSFIANGAKIIGDVTIKEGASIWFNCVLRGDVDKIVIGKYTNIQDGTVIHTDPGIPTVIGDYVTVGHGAILHACTVKNKALIGMGSIVLDGAEIGEGAIVAAGAVVTPETVIPPNSLVVGTPAKVIKTLNVDDQEERIKHALRYEKLWKEFYKK